MKHVLFWTGIQGVKMPTCDKCRLGTLCIHYGPGKDAWERGRQDAWNSDAHKAFIEENTRLRAYASVFWPLIIELKDSAEYVSGDFLSDLADEYVARLKEEQGE